MGFLDLPRELRDQIYQYAFRARGAIFMYSPNPYVDQPLAKAMIVRYKDEGPIEPCAIAAMIPMALLKTCRQVHAEGSAVLYGDNIFRIWFLSDNELGLPYRLQVRHVIFTAEIDHRIFGHDLEEVGYWWKRRFWPSVTKNGQNMLDRFPQLATLTLPLKPPRHGEVWRPAFMNARHKTRDQRIALAASWMKLRCPWEHEALRRCLRLDIESLPPSKLSKEEYEGSRFAPDEDDDTSWDSSEFTEAFQLMKL